MKVDHSDRSRALDIAIEAGRKSGIDTADAKILRVQSSIHVEFPVGRALARVETAGRAAIAHRQVQSARAWGRAGAPVASLIQPELQPFVFGDEAVTLWSRLRQNGTIDMQDLGRTTRLLHSMSQGFDIDGFPRVDVLADVRPWLQTSGAWLHPGDRALLADRLKILGTWWEEHSSSDPLGTVLVHGDLHRANALNTEHGIVLIDLEHSGVGPAGWDMAPLAAGVRRYGDPKDEFERFIKGYGADPREWSGHEMMCQIYQLMVTIWALRCSDVKPEMVKEAQIRVDGILGRSSDRWTMS